MKVLFLKVYSYVLFFVVDYNAKLIYLKSWWIL